MIMEVKSKRDWSDVASLITVDEITAEVENRRETKPVESSDEWTKVDFEDGLKQDSEAGTLLPQPEDLPVAVADEEAVEDEDDILDGDEYDEEEDEDDDGEEAGDEFTDGEHGKSISTQQGGTHYSNYFGRLLAYSLA
jgi:mitogen-activated protein kinase kinase kinase